MAQEDLLKKVIAHSKEYGFIFQSSEIYAGFLNKTSNTIELCGSIEEYTKSKSFLFVPDNGD